MLTALRIGHFKAFAETQRIPVRSGKLRSFIQGNPNLRDSRVEVWFLIGARSYEVC